ncbi:MAG: hypothetical protein QOE59_3469 [Actinomycetota bacterium]|jgi:hypothetical protein|nr:hypothetical protein [Actinomycetota bacterium]
MKLLLAGTRVSPSRMTDVQGLAGHCWAAHPSVVEVPFAGLARTRAFAAVPSPGGVGGYVSSERVLGGRPAGIARRMRQQHIDLDPHRPRPCGGCG